MGSTMYRSLGLDTLKKQREHYDQFVFKNKTAPFPEGVQIKLDHGKENEVSNTNINYPSKAVQPKKYIYCVIMISFPCR